MIDQGELFDIPSPCKRICELNNRGYCKGCFRSRDERLYWNQFTAFQKQLVVNLCEKRRLKVLAARNHHPQLDDEYIPPQFDLFTIVEDTSSDPDETALSATGQAIAEPVTPEAVETADSAADIQASTCGLPQEEQAPEKKQTEQPENNNAPQNSLFDEPAVAAADVATANAAAPDASNKDTNQATLFSESASEEAEKELSSKAAVQKEETVRSKAPRNRKKPDDNQIDMFS